MTRRTHRIGPPRPTERRSGLALVVMVAATVLPTACGDEPEVGPPGVSARDPEIEAMLRAVSTDRIKARIERLAAFGTRHTLSDAESTTRGIGAARRWLRSEFEAIAEKSGGRLRVEFDSYVQQPTRRVRKPTEVVNVVATLPGSDDAAARRLIVVGAHYDSRASDVEDAEIDAPGANDDASGTAVVLELAEVMARSPFEATLVFVAFAGEEQGLLGSTHFAEAAKAAGRRVEAMLTNDIVGNTEGTGGRRDNRAVRVFSEGLPDLKSPLAARLRAVGGEHDSPSRQLARFVDDAARAYTAPFDARPVFRSDRYLRGGDHMPFLERGYAAVRLTEPSEDFSRQHQNVHEMAGKAYGDVPERVDYTYVASVARVNLAAAASLALAPSPPSDIVLDTGGLTNDSTLAWTASPEADLAGYEVVWRDTTAPLWEESRFVGRSTKVTLPELSKDDLHFGVRAVDRKGHRSPVTFALPGRVRRD